MNDETSRQDRKRARAARAVIWMALAVAAIGVLLWARGHLGLLAPILAGAAAVVAVTAGPLMKAREQGGRPGR